MSYLLSSFLLSINTLLIFVRKKSKFITFITIFLMWILFWGNYMNPDYNNYYNLYSTTTINTPIFNELGSEVGFRLLVKFFSVLNVNYPIFLAIISLIGFLLIHSTVSKFSENFNLIYAAYFVFPFVLDVIQIRNFIAMSIFIFSIKYLVFDNRINRLKFIMTILIASSFHYSAVLYIPLVFITFDEEKWNKSINYIKYIALLNSLLILLNNRTIPFLVPIANFFFESDKVLAWTESRTNWGFLLYWLTHFVSLGLIGYIKNNIEKEREYNFNITEENLKVINLVYMINVVLLLFLPLYFLASTFFRIFRNILILNYTIVSVYNSVSQNSSKRIVINLFFFLYVLLLFLFHLYFPLGDEAILPVMENNYFFN